MTLLAPAYLIAAVLVAAGIIAAHLISTQEPRAFVLPTARFVPVAPVAARERRRMFTEPWLLLLRLLAVLLTGFALARPVITPRRERTARVIIADVSGPSGGTAAVRDTVRRLARAGDVIVPFDTMPYRAVAVSAGSGVDSAFVARRHGDRSVLSAALVSGYRAASTVRAGADSIELVVVSPLMAASSDRATALVRAQWPGRIRVVTVSPVNTPFAVMPARITWATSTGGNTLPERAVRLSRPDTVSAVVAGDDVVIAPFPRAWRFPAESLAAARVLARWIDGTAAAIEWGDSAACRRTVAITPDSAGDVVLRPDWQRLRRGLSGPCTSVASAPDPTLGRMLAGAGSLVSAGRVPADPGARSALAGWLMLAAIALAILELAVRAVMRRPA